MEINRCRILFTVLESCQIYLYNTTLDYSEFCKNNPLPILFIFFLCLHYLSIFLTFFENFIFFLTFILRIFYSNAIIYLQIFLFQISNYLPFLPFFNVVCFLFVYHVLSCREAHILLLDLFRWFAFHIILVVSWMPARKGLLAPQNTFLDTIATRFDGTRK